MRLGCAAPAAAPATTIGGLRAQVVGDWWLCTDSPGLQSTNAGPIAITADGRWINLVPDGNGGLVVGTAPADVATYVIETVFDGQTIVDGGPGLVLGVTTMLVVTTADGTQTQYFADPRQGALWMGYSNGQADGVWAYQPL